MALCGACTVHLDGQAIRSCVMPLSAVGGRHITTIEGLQSKPAKAVQAAWIELQGRSRIGAGSLVAAGTVIRPGHQIPEGVLVAGVPGRIVRELTDEDRDLFANTAARYVSRAARHRDAVWRELAG